MYSMYVCVCVGVLTHFRHLHPMTTQLISQSHGGSTMHKILQTHVAWLLVPEGPV